MIKRACLAFHQQSDVGSPVVFCAVLLAPCFVASRAAVLKWRYNAVLATIIPRFQVMRSGRSRFWKVLGLRDGVVLWRLLTRNLIMAEGGSLIDACLV